MIHHSPILARILREPYLRRVCLSVVYWRRRSPRPNYTGIDGKDEQRCVSPHCLDRFVWFSAQRRPCRLAGAGSDPLLTHPAVEERAVASIRNWGLMSGRFLYQQIRKQRAAGCVFGPPDWALRFRCGYVRGQLLERHEGVAHATAGNVSRSCSRPTNGLELWDTITATGC